MTSRAPGTGTTAEATFESARGADPLGGDAPVAHVLSNGRFTTIVTGAGGGRASLGALALTRWMPDRVRDADGVFLYLRDLDAGTTWSATHQPVRRPAERYAVRFAPGCATFEREDDGIATMLEICVAPDHDAELRRVTLTNRGSGRRRIELTTYAEAVLNSAAGDVGHPAFSKLFVQTEHDARRGALLAKRRLRSPDDAPLWMAHALAGIEGDLEHETDRMRFLGRGRTTARPAALDAGARLGGTTGNVLDPVLALRGTVTLEPGASAVVVSLIAAAPDRAGVEAILDRFASDPAASDAAFDGARRRAVGIARDTGIAVDDDGAREMAAAIGRVAYGLDGDATAWRTVLDENEWLRRARGSSRKPDEKHVSKPNGAAAARAFAPASPSHDASGKTNEEPLRFFNGHGGFSADGREYVIRLESGDAGPQRPPLPWVNVIANERLGFLVSESGAGSTWSANSRENRLTPWLNDPVSDPHAEALWLRDEEAGVFWSPLPGPTPAPGGYEVRHGFGYTRWRHASHDLEQEVTTFVPRRDPVRIVHLRLTNRGARARRLSAISYAQLVLGGVPWETSPTIETRVEGGTLYASNPAGGEFAGMVAFAAARGPAASSRAPSLTSDRLAFLGRHGDAAAPAALRAGGDLDGRTGRGLDACAALQLPLDVAAGATVECVFLLGQGKSAAEARELVSRHGSADAARSALDDAIAAWRELVDGVQVETPSPEIDLMVNGWLTYQNLSCRLHGRTAFYQSGGAFGFRDQLQDSLSLLSLDPSIARRQIVLHASHQFVEGDVLHWWHPPTSKGIRTRFADDLLWLPYAVATYINATGDATVLDEQARFVAGEALEPGEDEAFLFPTDSGKSASVYEHCCLTIERSLAVGAHGLPLIGTGDWNDGMNRVGREGRGESTWLGFFLVHLLDGFLPFMVTRGDTERAKRFRAHRGRLASALNADGQGWDGGWYRRAYYDDGTPLGAASNDECRIDTIAQAWAVISGVASAERARLALDAMERHLVSEKEGIIRLLTPAFDRTPHDPGYIKGYLPGVRENGGQYTHGALWAVRALAEAGRNERAAPLLAMLSPVSHGRTAEEIAVYMTEPYVIAADVYGVAPHVGRGGWTWYTGSAGWMFRVALESILGLCLEHGDTLRLQPCIPAAWPGFTLRYRLPDRKTSWEIVVKRGTESTSRAVADGARVETVNGTVRVPMRSDGRAHRLELVLRGRAS